VPKYVYIQMGLSHIRFNRMTEYRLIFMPVSKDFRFLINNRQCLILPRTTAIDDTNIW